MESKRKTNRKSKLIDTENRLVAARDGVGVGKMGEGNQKVQTSSYKLNKSEGCNESTATIVNNTVLHI